MSDLFHPYDLLKSVVHLSNSSIPIHIKLDQMLQSISETFQSDRCLLLSPEKIIKNGFLCRLVLDKKPLWVEEGSSFQKENVLLEEKDLLCPTFACIPLYDGASSQGILYLGFSRHTTFSPQEVDLLLLIGETIQRAIRNDDIHQKAEETISELTALSEMGKTVTSTLKLESLFELIVATGLKTLKARGGVLRIEDRGTGELKVRCSVGDYHQNPLDEKITRRVLYTRTPLSFNHSGEESPSFSFLCAPFLSKGSTFGTLAFYDKESHSPKFDDKDLQRLLMMANQMVCALDNALIHHETSKMVQKQENRG